MDNQIKFTWSIKENKKDRYEIYNATHVLKTICRMGNEFHCVEVLLKENVITINFDGHHTFILKSVGTVIDSLRAYIEHNKGTLETWKEETKED